MGKINFTQVINQVFIIAFAGRIAPPKQFPLEGYENFCKATQAWTHSSNIEFVDNSFNCSFKSPLGDLLCIFVTLSTPFAD